MSAEIFDSPTKVSGQSVVTYVAGQPLIFSIQDTGTAPDRFVVWVTGAYTITGSSGQTLEAKLYLTPNANGKAYFDLSKIAEARLEPGLLQKGTGLPPFAADEPIHDVAFVDAAVGPTCRRYIIEVGTFDAGTESSPQDSETIFVINGTEQPKSGLFPSFVDYAAGGSRGFLTDRSSTLVGSNYTHYRNLTPLANESIGMLLGNDIGYPATTFFLWRGYDADGNTAVLSQTLSALFGNLTGERVLYFGLGYYTLRPNLIVTWLSAPAPFDADTLRRVEFGLYDSGTSDWVGGHVDLTWDDDTACRNGFIQLAYTNTRGAWDYLRFDSRMPKKISTQGKQYRKSLLDYSGSTFSMDGKAAQYETYGKTGRVAYTLQSPFFTTEEREQLEIALRAKHVQIRRVLENTSSPEGWQPATITTNSVVIEPAGSRFYNVSLDVEVAQDVRC